jgi:hypothetical protein
MEINLSVIILFLSFVFSFPFYARWIPFVNRTSVLISWLESANAAKKPVPAKKQGQISFFQRSPMVLLHVQNKGFSDAPDFSSLAISHADPVHSVQGFKRVKTQGFGDQPAAEPYSGLSPYPIPADVWVIVYVHRLSPKRRDIDQAGVQPVHMTIRIDQDHFFLRFCPSKKPSISV